MLGLHVQALEWVCRWHIGFCKFRVGLHWFYTDCVSSTHALSILLIGSKTLPMLRKKTPSKEWRAERRTEKWNDLRTVKREKCQSGPTEEGKSLKSERTEKFGERNRNGKV